MVFCRKSRVVLVRRLNHFEGLSFPHRLVYVPSTEDSPYIPPQIVTSLFGKHFNLSAELIGHGTVAVGRHYQQQKQKTTGGFFNFSICFDLFITFSDHGASGGFVQLLLLASNFLSPILLSAEYESLHSTGQSCQEGKQT